MASGLAVEVVVKVEAVEEWCGESWAAAQAGLYAGHAVKDELMLGPELLQPADAAYALQGKNAATQYGASCEEQLMVKTCFVRLERICVDTHQYNGQSALAVPDLSHKNTVHPCSKEMRKQCKIKTDFDENKLIQTMTPRNYDVQRNSNQRTPLKLDLVNTDEKPSIYDISHVPLKQKNYLKTCTHTGHKTNLYNSRNDPFVDRYLIRDKKNYVDEIPYTCHVCNKQYKSKNKLTKHLKVHASDQLYSCDICNKYFHSNSYLILHKRTHTGEKPYLCGICTKQFKSKGNLTKHLRSIHTGIKPYSCNFCNKLFAEKFHLIQHERVHTGEKPFTCDICKNKFSAKLNLMKHLRVHSDGSRPCSTAPGGHFVCYKPVLITCDICNQQFISKTTWTAHLRSCTGDGDKPYKCDVCKKRFSRSDSLSRHHLIHTKEKPYTCDVCNKQFNRKECLRNHFRNVCSSHKC